MKERKWVDCPVCGAAGTMKLQEGLNESFRIAGGYPSITIKDMSGRSR